WVTRSHDRVEPARASAATSTSTSLRRGCPATRKSRSCLEKYRSGMIKLWTPRRQMPVPSPALVRTRALTLTAAIAGSSVAVTPGDASASPLDDATTTGVFTGPTHPHPTSVFSAPAAMGLAGRGMQLALVGGLHLDQLTVDRRLIDPETGALAPGPRVSPLTWTPGGLVAFTSSVAGDRGYVGLAV